MLLRNISCSFGGKSAEAWPRTDNTTRDFTLTRTLTSEVGPGVGDGFSPRHVSVKRKNNVAKRGHLFPIGAKNAFTIFLSKKIDYPNGFETAIFFSSPIFFCSSCSIPSLAGGLFFLFYPRRPGGYLSAFMCEHSAEEWETAILQGNCKIACICVDT